MSTQRIKIPRTSDRTIEKVFRQLAAKFGVQQAHVAGLGFVQIGPVSLAEEPGGDWKALLDYDSYLLENMHLQIAGMSVVFTRGGQYPPENKSPIFDEIVLTQNSHQEGTNKERLEVLSFISQYLRPFEPNRVLSGAPTEEQSQLLAMHESTLERLERLNEDLVRQSAEFRKKLEDQFAERSEKAEKEYLKKKSELDAELKLKAADLESERRTLDERLRLIDDRDNTHARREIRDRMLEDVKQRVNQFGVSTATEQKRRPVFTGIATLALVFFLLLGWTAYEIAAMDRQYFSMLEALRNISSWGAEKITGTGLSPETIAKLTASDVDRTHLYWLWLRFTLFSFGMVATILYYVRWQNKWAEQHSANEFQLRQFQIDISRANWVLESCLEWQKNTNSTIPTTLLDSITRGLFIGSTEPEQVVHPADELASALLGSASKLKIKSGENEIEYDKPGKIPNKT